MWESQWFVEENEDENGEYQKNEEYHFEGGNGPDNDDGWGEEGVENEEFDENGEGYGPDNNDGWGKEDVENEEFDKNGEGYGPDNDDGWGQEDVENEEFDENGEGYGPDNDDGWGKEDVKNEEFDENREAYGPGNDDEEYDKDPECVPEYDEEGLREFIMKQGLTNCCWVSHIGHAFKGKRPISRGSGKLLKWLKSIPWLVCFRDEHGHHCVSFKVPV